MIIGSTLITIAVLGFIYGIWTEMKRPHKIPSYCSLRKDYLKNKEFIK